MISKGFAQVCRRDRAGAAHVFGTEGIGTTSLQASPQRPGGRAETPESYSENDRAARLFESIL